MQARVLVVGAGPVGLTMAAELMRYGVVVRLVDRAAQRSRTSKALVLWPRTLELLERAEAATAFVEAGHKVEAANIVAGAQRIAHVAFGSIESPYRFALMLPQSETERLLEAHLQSLGGTVEREVELTAVRDTGHGVTTVLRHASGDEETLDTDWVIACDGAHSTVRHALGLSFLGETLRSDWMLADVHLTGQPIPPSELVIYLHEDGVLAVFPIHQDRYRIIADLGRSEGARPPDPTLAQMQAIVDRRGPGGVQLSDPVWLSAFRINERMVGDYRAGRVFLTGDAAHVHSPAGGQGMNTGMQDAFNLAWKLALVCRGTCPADPLLASYSAERSSVGARVLADAGRMTAVAVVKNHALQSVRNLIGQIVLGLAPARRAMANTLSEVSVGYPGSPLNGRGARGVGGPVPGERMPPIPGAVPVGSGDVPRFAVFAPPDDTEEAATQLLQRYAALVEPAIRPAPPADGIRLVRPDGYVAMVAARGSWTEVGDYLDRFTGGATARPLTPRTPTAD